MDTTTVTTTIVKSEYHATVRDVPVDDRPRERLEKHGAEALSNSDLLAIILRTGTQRDNVMELASKLLAKYNGLGGLMSAAFHELCNEYGLGAAKTAQLKAALELGKRLSLEQPDKKYQIRSADDAARLVRVEMMHLDHEEMHVLILDTKNQVIERMWRQESCLISSCWITW
jgi:DNA repair protein RadC